MSTADILNLIDFYSNINFRPDNWVMYHAMEKVPLPNLPQLSMHNGSISNEMPRPITLRPEKKKKT